MTKHLAYAAILLGAVGCGTTDLIAYPVDLNLDAGCPTPCEKQAYYPDFDGDGYGDRNAQPVMLCTVQANAIAGLSLDHTDCDDHEPLAHPGVLAYHKDPMTNTVGVLPYDWDCDGYELGTLTLPCDVVGCR
jgi:hypothetical protein